MRAIVLDRDQVTVRDDHPLPILADGEVLVRVMRAGICETDLQLIRGYMGFRGVLGHVPPSLLLALGSCQRVIIA